MFLKTGTQMRTPDPMRLTRRGPDPNRPTRVEVDVVSSSPMRSDAAQYGPMWY